MIDWTALAAAGKELARAFDLLDHAGRTDCRFTAAVVTRMGLIEAAREAVQQSNKMLLT